jgi:hypothetical protein
VTAFVPYRIKKVHSTPNTVNTHPQSRDERIVKNLQIAFSVDSIINSSTEEFQEMPAGISGGEVKTRYSRKIGYRVEKY